MAGWRIAAAAAVLVAAPAAAQEAAPLPDPDDRSDMVMIGAGGAWLPDYEGSDDYRLIPAAFIRGRLSGISFATRGSYLYVDLIAARSGNLELDLGPIGGVRLNRSSRIKDDAVDRLAERDMAVELGGFAGVSFTGLTNPYDSLSLRLDAVKDVADVHDSWVLTPSIDFSTPLSRFTYVGASLSGDFVSDDFADAYFGIDPADALASGLPPFDADGGLKNWKIGLVANHSLTGDLTGGLSLFATGHYSRLLGDFRRSPIVDQRGSASQWLGALGLAYTF